MSDSIDDDDTNTDLGSDNRTVRVQHVRLASKNGEGEVIGILQREQRKQRERTLDRIDSIGGGESVDRYDSVTATSSSSLLPSFMPYQTSSSSSSSSFSPFSSSYTPSSSSSSKRNDTNIRDNKNGLRGNSFSGTNSASSSSNLDQDNQEDNSFDQLEGGISPNISQSTGIIL